MLCSYELLGGGGQFRPVWKYSLVRGTDWTSQSKKIYSCLSQHGPNYYSTNQRHILRDRRPSTTACPARWAIGTKELKQCTMRKKIFLDWADWSSQGWTKISCNGTTSPMNQPGRSSFMCTLWVAIHLSFNSQQGLSMSSLYNAWYRHSNDPPHCPFHSG
jgi:hypothetical protein